MPNIRDWYKSKKGTINGLPVLHVSVNIVSSAFVQEHCDNFVNYHHLEVVMNDYNANAYFGPLQTNAVHDRFERPFVKPVFAVINCLTNSSQQYPRRLMLLENSENGPADFGDATIARWRAAIDAVQAPWPRITDARLGIGGAFQFNFLGQRGRTNQVLCSSNLATWTVLTNVTGTNAPILFRDTNALSNGARTYRLRRL